MADAIYDVLIIGSGPAGIQAAIHASRKKVRVLMLGRIENSALYGAHIENYAFVPGVTDGGDILRTGIEQATSFGAEYSKEDVLKIVKTDTELFTVTLENDRVVTTRTIIFSMGVAKKKLNVPGEKDFRNWKVSCSTVTLSSSKPVLLQFKGSTP